MVNNSFRAHGRATMKSLRDSDAVLLRLAFGSSMTLDFSALCRAIRIPCLMVCVLRALLWAWSGSEACTCGPLSGTGPLPRENVDQKCVAVGTHSIGCHAMKRSWHHGARIY
ncbi:hypothetical protein Micbo1qcDRAFT_31459 [Microdochium bolleyi]|uniref:Uncharacterized protein n=1 Tax=Microdochium bolleyi TaxID=196109 RepID=A0A136JGA7_9PEZI|nr:hypothetical protein Micbo1qcDRAFT_31459 [Microdochium bolleyi]